MKTAVKDQLLNSEDFAVYKFAYTAGVPTKNLVLIETIEFIKLRRVGC